MIDSQDNQANRTSATTPGDTLRTDLAAQLLANLKGATGPASPDTSSSNTAVAATGEEPPHAAEALIRDAVKQRATDVHLEPQKNGLLLRLRIDGELISVALLDPFQSSRLINQFKTLAAFDPVASFTPLDNRFRLEGDWGELDTRVSLTPCVAGEKMAIRLMDTVRRKRSITDLGFNQEMLKQLRQWLDSAYGMLLVGGPTGSGKTTTLYALIRALDLTARSVVTLEDPVEYQVDGITQIQLDPEHGLDLASGIKAMLRLDPDHLLLGEVRDAPSAKAAVSAAMAGHLLFSTIHSHDPVAAIEALRNWNLEDHEIVAAISMIIAQRLVRKLCPHCREQKPPQPADRAWLQAASATVPDTIWHPVGCNECQQLGYSDRIGIFEIWSPTSEQIELILDHADDRSLRASVYGQNHMSLLADALAKVEDGVTTVAELRASHILNRPAENVTQQA